MSPLTSQIHAFHRYALEKADIKCSEMTIDELFDQWRAENPSSAEYQENVAAISASIDDFRDGERGTPAGEHSASLRSEFGLDE